jgi:hypothetical protein
VVEVATWVVVLEAVTVLVAATASAEEVYLEEALKEASLDVGAATDSDPMGFNTQLGS